MDQNSDLIREDMDATKEQLTQKLGELESHLRSTVETARETVKGTIDDVKTNLRKLTPSYQVERRPLVLLGGAVAAGFVTGRRLQRSELRFSTPSAPSPIEKPRAFAASESIPPTSEYEDNQPSIGMSYTRQHDSYYSKPSLWDKFTETFADEIEMVKTMAIGAVLSTLRDAAKRTLPDIAPNIDEVMGSAMKKFGVDPEPPGTEGQRR